METSMIEEVKIVFNKFDSNLIAIAFAKAKSNTGKLSALIKVHEDILATVHKSDAEFQECFFKLLVAEYKEYLYKNMFEPTFDLIERNIMREYSEFLNSGKEHDDLVLNHKHDPDHIIFYDNKAQYMFYEVVESRGYSILKISQSDEALADFKSDIICDYCDEFVM